MPRQKLSPKQTIFIRAYVKTRNATKAAILAGYSQKTAGAQAGFLLKNIAIQNAVNKALTRYCEKIELSPGHVLKALADHAFYDSRNLYDEHGEMIDVHKLDDRTAKAIAGVEHITLYDGEGDQKHAYGHIKKVKLTDRLRALELLGKHLQLFPTNVQVGGSDGGAVQIEVKVRHIGGSSGQVIDVEPMVRAIAVGGTNGDKSHE